MKNTECTIFITTKHGWTQRYHKEKTGWIQTCSNGTVHHLSAEQLLSHVLPLLVETGPNRLQVKRTVKT